MGDQTQHARWIACVFLHFKIVFEKKIYKLKKMILKIMIVFAACEKYIFNHANYLFISFLLYIKQGVISAL